MATLTIKNVPRELHKRLKQRAELHRRSINSEVIVLLEQDLMMRSREFEAISSQVLRLAASSGCSAYDCEFVALAQHLAVPLVTLDREVLTKFKNTAVSPHAFCAP